MEVFLDYLRLQGSTIDEKANQFYEFIKQEPKTFQNVLLNYFIFQNERAKRGEISQSIIPNYYKPIKLFCDMNDIVIDWRLVTRSIPKGRHASQGQDGRTPAAGARRPDGIACLARSRHQCRHRKNRSVGDSDAIVRPLDGHRHFLRSAEQIKRWNCRDHRLRFDAPL